MENANLLSVTQYAKKCGTTPQAIYQRAYRGVIVLTKGEWRGHPICLVDTNTYPPSRLKKGRVAYTNA